MEDFLGTWKLVKSVSYDEYLKAIGVVQDPDDDVVTETLSKEEDSVVWTKVSSKQTVKMRFTLDKEFKMFSQDGRYSLITISLKENQLVQVQKMDKMISTIIREVQGPVILLAGKEYVVGRKNCDILLSNDQSISRVHAHITVSEQAVTLKDNSKYGTFVNEKRLETSSTKTVYAGDKLTFGVFQSKFRLELDSVVVCSSCVDNEGKATLSKDVQALGGRLVSTWSQECTHLVMPAVKVTIKTICALLCCRPIVKAEFFTELSSAVQQRKDLPKAESFRPVIDEPSLAKEKVDLGPRPERKTLFAGKTFVFLNSKQARFISLFMKRLSQAVSFGGGRSQLLEEGSMPVSLLESTGTCVVDITTGSSQTLMPSNTNNWATSVSLILHRGVECGTTSVGETPEKHPAKTLGSTMFKKPPVAMELPAASSEAMSIFSCVKEQKMAKSEIQKIDKCKKITGPLDNSATIKSSPQKQASLTSYFKPSNKKRLREGSTDSELSEAKISRQENQESISYLTTTRISSKIAQNQQDTAPCFGLSGSLSLGSGLATDSRSGGLQQNPGLNLDSNDSSKKRKEPEQDPEAPADLDVSLEELESIMSEDMDELQPTASKKLCLDQQDKCTAIALANRNTEKTSLVLSRGLEQHGNDRCETVAVKGEQVSFLLETKDQNGLIEHSKEDAVKEEKSLEKDPELPRKLIQVQFMSLTVSAPGRTRAEPLQGYNTNGKNFKRFRKVPVPGLHGLPKIVGGSDLVPYNRSKSSELEEWLREAAEQEKQQEREESLGDDLFR
ncbi:Nibrin [Bagarius yarrelli]|uniref:Nibrin n=1 Tax=Bagarius yarrelli TaxID=175774 RepID=A0A556V920_BAGYA|nr:Nibrin [Bagarius yarrelli]